MCKCWYIRTFTSYLAVPVWYGILNNTAISFRCYLAQYPEQYGHLIQVLSGHTGTVSWTIRPSHSGVIWHSILNNTAISSRCYLALLIQYPEQYGHLIQVLSGRTNTVSWTTWPSHSDAKYEAHSKLSQYTCLSPMSQQGGYWKFPMCFPEFQRCMQHISPLFRDNV